MLNTPYRTFKLFTFICLAILAIPASALDRFTKIDANGNALPADATGHQCVYDSTTNLLWEVKTDDGGLRDKDWKYTWYFSNSPDGIPGTPNGGSCYQYGRCDTEKFAADVNAAGGLCGVTDWYVPNKEQLRSIVDSSLCSPCINTDYFPYTNSVFWSSTPMVTSNPPYHAISYQVSFSDGYIYYTYRSDRYHVRLVRDGQSSLPLALSVAKAGNGTGTITSNPAGINCGSDCNKNYASGTSVTLIAAPAAGSVFAGWSGDADCNDGSVTMNAAKNCTATFNLNITAPTATTGTATNITQTSAKLNGTVISSGATAYVTFDFGTTTSYGTNSTATPYQVYSASAVAVSASKTGLTCNTIYHYRVQASNSAGTNYGANQSLQTAVCPTYTLILTKQGAGNGTVTSSPAGINCGTACSANFAINTNITLTATPNTGSAFGGFSGATDCNDGYITMDTGKNCIATFNLQPSNGVCGSSNGGTFNTAPTTFLCNSGTATAVTGTGPWNWNCAGSNGGTNASCNANIARYTATASVGTGGTVNPNSATVNYNVRASFTVTANNGYTRNNAVTGTCPAGNWNGNIWTTGNITTACNLKFTFTPIIPSVNGVCGTANGSNFNIKPTANLCSVGTASAVTGSGPWNWNCAGSNGGSTANCAANINRYTATVSTAIGGTVNPSSVTVNYNARANFTVTANNGYTRNNAVTGNCPAGTWNGNVWTTGAITANCTVTFGFTPTAINSWLFPTNPIVLPTQAFTLTVTAKSNSQQIGSYRYEVTFDVTKLAIDYTQCSATNGVCAGNDAPAFFTANVNYATNPATITLNGLGAIGPGNDLQLLTIHFKSQNTFSTTPVTLKTLFLDNADGNSIGIGAAGATVNIVNGICGDADGNTRVNIVDALAIARKVVGMPPPPTVDVTLADVNQNGALSIVDALHIARYSIGLVVIETCLM